MRRVVAVAVWLVAAGAAAQKPWEVRVDYPVPAPLALPAVPPTNPFASPLLAPPQPSATPLVEHFNDTFTVLASVYVGADGSSRRVVFTQLPWPGVEAAMRQALAQASFSAPMAAGGPVAAWISVAVDLHGRINQGRFLRIGVVPPDPSEPPVPEPGTRITVDPADVTLPAVPVDGLEQLPGPRRFRAQLDGSVWRQGVRAMVEIGVTGRCERVVFLSCPEGLRAWLLASMATWSFRPAQTRQGASTAWVLVQGDLEVRVGDLASNALRIIRQRSYPYAAQAPGAVHPPGE
jgi:hypothetical protein